MKIKYLKHNKIDRQKWDNHVKKAKNCLIYGYSWYLDIVSPNWEALVSLDYKYIMPLTSAKKYFLSYLRQPTFFQKNSIFSENEITKSIIKEFLKAIPKKYVIVEMSLNHNLSELESKYNAKKRTNYELYLNNTYENIYQNYSKSHKKNIKKVNKSDYKFIISDDVETYIDIKKQDIKFSEAKNKELHLETLKKLIVYVLEHNLGAVFFAVSAENKYLAAIFAIKLDKQIIKVSARTPEGRKKGLSFFIHDKVIEYYANKDLTFDFVGSDIEGVAYFNKGFGSKKKDYYAISKRLF